MKGYVCLDCSYRWYEPDDNKKKPGWGCPNGCSTHGFDTKKNSKDILIDIFGRWLDKEKDEKEKEKLRYHLSLLRGKIKYN